MLPPYQLLLVSLSDDALKSDHSAHQVIGPGHNGLLAERQHGYTVVGGLVNRLGVPDGPRRALTARATRPGRRLPVIVSTHLYTNEPVHPPHDTLTRPCQGVHISMSPYAVAS